MRVVVVHEALEQPDENILSAGVGDRAAVECEEPAVIGVHSGELDIPDEVPDPRLQTGVQHVQEHEAECDAEDAEAEHPPGVSFAGV